MATFVVGDIHGCYDTLRRLLRKMGFDAGRDRLWLVGDLVNRGPRSLEVVRWARGLGDRLTMVLGNHDLHLLSAAAGAPNAKETPDIVGILEAADGPELCDWLRSRPLIHREDPWLLAHAGLHPSWSVTTAEALAREVERALRGADANALLGAINEKPPRNWSVQLAGLARLQFIVRVLTRLRICNDRGEVDWGFTGTLDEVPDGFHPWFRVPGRRNASAKVLFGHWAALGYHAEEQVIGLDSGVAWGNCLTAVRLDDRQVFWEARSEPLEPRTPRRRKA